MKGGKNGWYGERRRGEKETEGDTEKQEKAAGSVCILVLTRFLLSICLVLNVRPERLESPERPLSLQGRSRELHSRRKQESRWKRLHPPLRNFNVEIQTPNSCYWRETGQPSHPFH